MLLKTTQFWLCILLKRETSRFQFICYNINAPAFIAHQIIIG